jgi:hypothetical protein
MGGPDLSDTTAVKGLRGVKHTRVTGAGMDTSATCVRVWMVGGECEGQQQRERGYIDSAYAKACKAQCMHLQLHLVAVMLAHAPAVLSTYADFYAAACWSFHRQQLHPSDRWTAKHWLLLTSHIMFAAAWTCFPASKSHSMQPTVRQVDSCCIHTHLSPCQHILESAAASPTVGLHAHSC